MQIVVFWACCCLTRGVCILFGATTSPPQQRDCGILEQRKKVSMSTTRRPLHTPTQSSSLYCPPPPPTSDSTSSPWTGLGEFSAREKLDCRTGMSRECKAGAKVLRTLFVGHILQAEMLPSVVLYGESKASAPSSILSPCCQRCAAFFPKFISAAIRPRTRKKPPGKTTKKLGDGYCNFDDVRPRPAVLLTVIYFLVEVAATRGISRHYDFHSYKSFSFVPFILCSRP